MIRREIVFANGSKLNQLNCPQHIDPLPHPLRDGCNDVWDAFDHDITHVPGALRTRQSKPEHARRM